MFAPRDLIFFVVVALIILAYPLWPAAWGGGAVVGQKLMIFGLFAVGFNILFGLTGYLSFGHAAFVGVGSYTAIWSMKLFSTNPLLATFWAILVVALFSIVIGFVCLRRSGIYFSILTLAFASMMYNLAYSVLTPITGGETSIKPEAADPRILDRMFGVGDVQTPVPDLFGLLIKGWNGYYFCAAFLIIGFFISIRVFRSPFGTMLRGIKSNQKRIQYTGINPKPYLLSAFVISGIYAGVAGALMVAVNPFASADRMFWTASGEVVIMNILGGVGTLIGPLLGSTLIEYLKINVATINDVKLNNMLSFLPDSIQDPIASVVGLFVGDGWLLLLGVIFMLVIVFLPGGIVDGFQRIGRLFGARKRAN